jgi:biopolymer transport protein ExbB
MKKILPPILALSSLFCAHVFADPSFDDAMKKAASDYRERLAQAADELNRTRSRIAAEKAPLLEQTRAAENRIIAAESQITRLDTGREDSSEQRRKLLQEFDAVRKTTTYASTLAHDSLRAVADGLPPGEAQLSSEHIEALLKQLDDPSAGPSGRAAMDIADYLLARTERALGGWRAEGQAMLAETNEVVPGTFAFMGPETYFRPKTGGAAGAVRSRDGVKFPASYALSEWKPAEAAAFFTGQPGTVVADASGGKALRLKETTGTLWDHVRKGGLVAFAIIGVGLIALLLIIQKVRDLAQMSIDTPDKVDAFIEAVASDSTAEAERAFLTMKRTTRELFAAGLRYADQSKTILEERLQAVLLAQRLHYERRLPLLAVIATAAPLMGLLGTVVGMVKTFALITVFGTGNAAKLSSGISEVLVATELGLAVAIPTLIAHGFLTQRIHKNLSLLERYALQFCTAVETARTRADSVPVKKEVPA